MADAKKNTGPEVEPPAEAPAPEQPAPDKPEPIVGDPAPAEKAEHEQMVYIDLSELHAFKNHPFGIRDDTEMQGLVESDKTSGINQPRAGAPPLGERL